jgi:hypothetical protein
VRHWARILHDEYGYGEAASDLRTAADHIATLEAKLAEGEALVERAHDAYDELAGATGLTPGDQIMIDSAFEISAALAGESDDEATE